MVLSRFATSALAVDKSNIVLILADNLIGVTRGAPASPRILISFFPVCFC